MSWARNIQTRFQQQQQFQQHKPAPLSGNSTPSATTDSKPQPLSTSPSLSSVQKSVSPNASPLNTSISNITPPSPMSLLKNSGNSGVTQPSSNLNTSGNSVVQKTTNTSSGSLSDQVNNVLPKMMSNASISNISSSNVSTNLIPNPTVIATPASTTTTTSTNKTSPSLSPLPSPSQSPMQSRSSTLQPPSNTISSGRSNTSSTSTTTTGMPYQFQQKIVQKVLTTDMFRGVEFSHVSFVEDLTRKLVNDQTSVDGLRFDPAPFNTLFLNTQLQLSQLESNIDRKLDDLAEECNDFSLEYKNKLQDLLGSYQECFQHFKKLEKGVNTIGTKAVHFGDELDSVNQQKVKAQGALSLINYLLELNSEETTSKRSDIFTNSERIHELANLVKKLSSVSEDIKEISGFKKGKLETETLSNTLENDLINQFERAAERNDFEKMKQCATTLYNFNGGERCRARYIQKLKMFFDIDSLRKDESLANNTSKRQIRGNNIIDTRFEIFFSDILRDIQHEQNVIQNVFVNQTSAMAMLIVRVFEQRVRTFIENVLQIEMNNTSMFLQTVHNAYNCTKKLLVDPLSSYGINGVDLNQLLNSIFYTYQEGYIQKERDHLIDLFESTVREECDRLMTLDKMFEYEEDGLNPEITQTFVQQTENALTRSYTLSPENLLPENIKTIFFLMLKYLFEDYITFVLEKYIKLPLVSDSRCQQAISQLFRVILSINQIVGQIQTLFQMYVLPHIQTSIMVQSQCSDQLYFNISSLENNINYGLENSLLMMVQLVDKSLLDQKKTDYQLDDYDNSVTPTCNTVIKLIQSFYDIAKSCLQGKNFHIFVEEFGLKLQVVFLNHFKKFKIGQGVGALKLIRDLTEYRNISKLFKSHKVDDAFELLFEISKLHLVNPENFKSVIEGGALTRMQKSDLIAFIKQRSDFKSIWLDNL